ncbi:MAG: AmmeMemoRadiSam system radical SAM enzyme [Candidatus Latescibacteria bacterium]|nr:AmmeMemoRadiSam system radical SAM enzyme [Candidatus Latescibacterota bacterium]
MSQEKRNPGGTLEDRLRSLSVKGTLSETLTEERVRCYACAHRCLILPGHQGICKVRYNKSGTLYVPGGYVSSLQCDPIEKKPFFHAMPGSLALSFGMLGCDYHCSFCQNWITSQALRDDAAGAPVREISAEEMIRLAIEGGASIVTSTYNEPLITAEWSVEVFEKAHDAGLYTSYVSNGNATPEVLEYLDPHIDFFKVDLKAFSKENYRQVGGRLEPVLDTIERLVGLGKWVEVVTLLLPGINDSDEELKEIAAFLAGVSPGIPWHVTAYHPEYKMAEPGPTPVSTLRRAAEIGREAGLHFVYAGNLPGLVGKDENTSCPDCGELLIKRHGFRILAYKLNGSLCPTCGREIPGRWPEATD